MPRQRLTATQNATHGISALNRILREQVVHRLYVTRCPDVTNYPASPTSFISTYKIYAVRCGKKYKSNSN
jgi:hypothetical protein